MTRAHGDPNAAATLRFPDVSKLQLDQLIDELVERAQDVRSAQGRLRALLRAIEDVNGELELDTVLRRVVEAACALLGARYGALGVIGADGGLERFVHTGFDAATVRAIGALPAGKGLLGALISAKQPVRLRDLAGDPRAAGLPAGHPPLHSFLGMPVRVRGEVYGVLYLAEADDGAFSDEHEELLGALAQAAGAAISNARLYDESQQRQQWLSASVEIGALVLARHGEDPVHAVARRAIEIAPADLVAVSLLTPGGDSLVVEAAFGGGADELVGRRFEARATLAGRAVVDATPISLIDARLDELAAPLAEYIDAGPVLIVPLQGTHRVHGVLSLVRRRGGRPFDDADLEMAAGFANQAATAIELGESREAEQRLVVLEERDRIARDLHDHVIQDLFATGIGIEAAAAVLGPDHPLHAKLSQRVHDIDRTIRRIRTSIFQLRGPLDAVAGGLRTAVLEITSDLTPALGFPPHVSFSGAVDLVVDADLCDDVCAVVREALTNVAKHAGARRVDLDVCASSTALTVTVADDGTGVVDNGRRSGTANLRARAERRGGSFDLSPGSSGGTVLTWKAGLT